MKIVCLSDTHGLHRQVHIPKCDMIIHAGDYTNVGRHYEHDDFCRWFAGIKAEYRVCIAGNHDFCASEIIDFKHRMEEDFPQITYLQDDYIKFLRLAYASDFIGV